MNSNPNKAIKILVVDDNQAIRTLLYQTLKQSGYENVTSASNGREGLDLCARSHFDLIICDILMPEVDGLEMIFALRKSSPTTHIIAISGGGQVDEMVYLDLAAKGGADTLGKPFDPPELLEKIRKHFG